MCAKSEKFQYLLDFNFRRDLTVLIRLDLCCLNNVSPNLLKLPQTVCRVRFGCDLVPSDDTGQNRFE